MEPARAPHERGPDRPPGRGASHVVHVHSRRQLASDVDAVGGHVQLVPARRQLPYETKRHQAVSVRQVIGEHGRRRDDEDTQGRLRVPHGRIPIPHVA